MAKNVFKLAGGAVSLDEDAGVFTLSFSESVGGGKASGIVKGSGSVVLDAQAGLLLAEQLLVSHLPSSMSPMAAIVEAVINEAVRAVE